MPAEPAPLSPSFPVALPPARLGRAERVTLAILAVIAALLLAAWQIPPLLDWSRYRGTIASYATARLGRPVSIAGRVRLTLLPQPMLMADRVTLADRGDGFSATLRTLRLEVALPSLLIGRVVPRALSLDDPQATLPWPPPRGATPHLPASGAGEFSATVNGGTLTLGGVTMREIDATLRTDPDTGAFSAQGNARVAGLPWRFTALLGAPSAAGISPLELTLDGRSAPRDKDASPDMQGTGGSFHGRLLADGALDGTIVLRGPDVSRLGAGPALPWQVQGTVTGEGLSLSAPTLALRLGGAAGQAGAALHLAPPASVSVKARLAALPAGAWMRRLLQSAPAPSIAATLDITADAVPLPGARLQNAHLLVSSGPDGLRVGDASATLPGGARVAAQGVAGPDAFTGTLAMQAPALRQTLAWITGAAPALPPGMLSSADLHGAFAASAARLAWSGLSGRIDGSPIAGAITATLGTRLAWDLSLTTPRLPLSGWTWPPAWAAPSMAAVLAPFDRADGTVTLAADTLDWPGMPLRHAMLRAKGSRAGISLERLALDLPGGHAEASGTLGADAALAGARLDLTAPDAAALPAQWRVPAGLWQGGFHLALTGEGPPRAIALTLRADLGDLRAEAEGHADATAPALTATATVRHPGAPRLLAALGLPGARDWLDDGSLALLAHLDLTPAHLAARDFSLSAGALQMGGRFDAATVDGQMRLSADIEAPTLALPGWPAGPQDMPGGGLLQHLQARIGLHAAHVLAGLAPVASDVSATLLASGGAAGLQDLRATLPGGRLTGDAAIDTSQDPPAYALRGEAAGLPPESLLPAPSHLADTAAVTLQGGPIDVSADLHGSGKSASAWLASMEGSARLILHDMALAGLTPPAPAMPLSGDIDALIQNGVAHLPGSPLASPAGNVQADGTIDLVRRSLALRLDTGAASARAIVLSGAWDAVHEAAAPMPGRAAPITGKHRRARRTVK